jgi:hypothetical protein
MVVADLENYAAGCFFSIVHGCLNKQRAPILDRLEGPHVVKSSASE